MRSLKDLNEEKIRIQRSIDEAVMDIDARQEKMRTLYAEYRRLEAEENRVGQIMEVRDGTCIA